MSTKLSSLLIGKITNFNKETLDFEDVIPDISTIRYTTVLHSEDLQKQFKKLMLDGKDRKDDENFQKENIYETIKLLTDVNIDLTIDEFKKQYETCDIIFSRFLRKLENHCIEQIKELGNIAEHNNQMIQSIEKSMKENIEFSAKLLKKQYEEEKDTKKKQQLFVEWKKAEAILNNKK